MQGGIGEGDLIHCLRKEDLKNQENDMKSGGALLCHLFFGHFPFSLSPFSPPPTHTHPEQSMSQEGSNEIKQTVKLLVAEFKAAAHKTSSDKRNLFFSLKNHNDLLKFTFTEGEKIIQDSMPQTHQFFTSLLSTSSVTEKSVRGSQRKERKTRRKKKKKKKTCSPSSASL